MAKHRAELKLCLTKTMINNARKLSTSLVDIYHQREKIWWFGGRSSVGGRPTASPLSNPALAHTNPCDTLHRDDHIV